VAWSAIEDVGTEPMLRDGHVALPAVMLVDLETRAVALEVGSFAPFGVRRRASASLKRAFDVVAVLLTAPLWMPLLTLLALGVKLTSRGPAFYVQERIGHRGRPLACRKLRTMLPDADSRLELILSSDPALREEFEANYKLRHDPRVTRFGRFLRRTGLDELPQLISVLRGDMSLVGPRPIVEGETKYYGRFLSLVAAARPGLTGLWQVSGRSDLPYRTRVALDVEYVVTSTFWSDLTVLAKTVLLAFRPSRRGAY
jgi:lipopolysaccharide/colanic/teichoic acid biosynthesis glycosyltransferase